jgi:hypothetical protein
VGTRRRRNAPGLGLRAALFEEGRDIADRGVLAELAGEAAAPEGAAARVRSDFDFGRARGVTGSPHFFLGERGWFSPLLRVEERDATLHVDVDEARHAELVTAARHHSFGPDRAP